MKNVFTICLILVSFLSLKATHNRSGEILYKRIAPFTSVVGSTTVQVYTYSITCIKYFDHGTNVADRCVDTIYFGDGQKGVANRINGVASGTCNCGSIPCGEIIENSSNYVVKKNIYSIIYTYAGPGTYLIRSIENRNAGIHNIPNSSNVAFYIEANMIITSSTGMNSSPVFSNPPTDRGINGTCMQINTAAFDADGDSLSYELSTCRDANGQTAAGYFLPETGSGGSFSVNATTGLITWCTPQFIDDYNAVIIVKEWRKTSCNGAYTLLGYVFRDFQIIIMSGSAVSFSCSALTDVCVKAGSTITKSFAINSSGVTNEVYGETASGTSSSVQISPNFSSGNANLTYTWSTTCSQARKKPYDVYMVFKSYNNQKFYAQFKVTVLPKTPMLYAPVADTGKVTLTWNTCAASNVTAYNIYRKTGINTWVPGSCEQGVSASSGFILVGTAPASAFSYTDSNVWPILNGTTAHYIVTAVTEDCAESRADNVQSVTLIVGINENQLAGDFKLYPNPFSDKIEIDFDPQKNKEIEVSVYSIDGKLIPTEVVKKVTGKYDLLTKNLSTGVYLIRIKSGSEFVTKKLVKQ